MQFCATRQAQEAMRKPRAKVLTLQDVEVHLEVEPDSIELVPLWFDDEQTVRDVLQRLRAGDAWAWSTVVMRLSYQGLMSRAAATPGCSFKDEAEFRRSKYFLQMVEECLQDLNQRLQAKTAATIPVPRPREPRARG
jgi:hypothetical protein